MNKNIKYYRGFLIAIMLTMPVLLGCAAKSPERQAADAKLSAQIDALPAFYKAKEAPKAFLTVGKVIEELSMSELTTMPKSIHAAKKIAFKRGADAIVILKSVNDIRMTRRTLLGNLTAHTTGVYAVAIKYIKLSSRVDVLQALDQSLLTIKSLEHSLSTYPSNDLTYLAYEIIERIGVENKLKSEVLDSYSNMVVTLANKSPKSFKSVWKGLTLKFSNNNKCYKCQNNLAQATAKMLNSALVDDIQYKSLSQYSIKLLKEGWYPNIMGRYLIKHATKRDINALNKIMRYGKYTNSRVSAAKILIALGKSEMVDQAISREEQYEVREKLREALLNS